ncbi:YceD family protein [Qingshengfaniella alkalisoli]|uniref:DUF177 domain-containing protein n=1 Tax=Qingshengfaniella alkalisoli TaxID=2599296 RepID=A0A5B8J4A8_9RHOB|nr:DUF177 domain-containing protein [Qingshengfaniella alkalisoli]QDY69347.1 DUF177 domain-containing protein [Qingshengfaniella alkalisoli]
MSQRTYLIRPGELRSQSRSFAFRPESAELEQIAQDLDILGLRKLSFEGALTPAGKEGWDLNATLGATVTQACVVTLKPVTTRIDTTVERRYRSSLPDDEAIGEVEMPDDETLEPLSETIDLGQVIRESLALELPPFPRADSASFGQAVFTEPGKTPMSDEDTKPFAGLAGLKERFKDQQ